MTQILIVPSVLIYFSLNTFHVADDENYVFSVISTSTVAIS